jgi:hypothetical protein
MVEILYHKSYPESLTLSNVYKSFSCPIGSFRNYEGTTVPSSKGRKSIGSSGAYSRLENQRGLHGARQT